MQHKATRSRPRQQRAFWFDLGRLIFPELINKPRDMQFRMIILTIGMATLLVGAMIGFYRRVNNPADMLMIQARELRR